MANRFPLIVDSVNENIKELPSGDNLDLTGNDALFGDDDKAIFGADSDLQISHNGSYSLIADSGTGNLILACQDFSLTNPAVGENMITAAVDGAVTLYYDNSPKLATTSTGVDITGAFTATSTGTVPTIYGGSGATQTFTLQSTSGNSNHSKVLIGNAVGADNGGISFYSAGASVATERMRISGTNGDITFYDTSGNASFVYDESAGSTFNEQGADRDFRVESDNNSHMFFIDASTDRIGINESSPDAFLDISGNGATTSKMFEISTSGIGGGPASTFYGGYVQVQANNDATDSFGWYVTNEHAGIYNDTTGVYGLATMGSSNKRSIGAYGSSSVNSAAVHNVPSNASSTVAAGVYAEADVSGTTNNSTNSALIAYNKSAYGNTAYGAYIRSDNGPTNSIPLLVDYAGNNIFEISASDGVTVNESSRDYIDFRVESDGNTHALFVDAGNNRVGILDSSPSHGFTINTATAVKGGSKVNLYTATNQNYGYIQNGGADVSNAIILAANGKVFTVDDQYDAKIYNSAGNVTYNWDTSAAVFEIKRANGTFAGTDTTKIDMWHYDDIGNPTGQILVGGTTNYTGDMVFKVRGGGTSGGGGAAIHEYMRMRGNERELVVNQDGLNQDFRVESDTTSHMLFVDASAEAVIIGNSSEATSDSGLSVAGSVIDNISIQYLGTSGGHASKFQFVDFRGQVNARINNNLQNDALGTQGAHLEFATAVGGTVSERLKLGGTNQTEAVFNDPGFDYDFRIESDNNTNMLFVDAGANIVNVGTSNSGYNGTFNVASGTNTQVAAFESALGGAGAAATIRLGVSTRSSQGLILGSNGSSATVNGGALAAYVLNSENAPLLFGTNNSLQAKLDTNGSFNALSLGYGTSITEPTSMMKSGISSSGNITFDGTLDSTTSEWSPGYVKIWVSQGGTGLTATDGAWWFYTFMTFNGALNGISLRDSGGGTASFTATLSDQGGTDPITIRINIGSNAGANRMIGAVEFGTYYGVQKVVQV